MSIYLWMIDNNTNTNLFHKHQSLQIRRKKYDLCTHYENHCSVPKIENSQKIILKDDLSFNNGINYSYDKLMIDGLRFICNIFPEIHPEYNNVSGNYYRQKRLLNLFNDNPLGLKNWLFIQMIQAEILLPVSFITYTIKKKCAIMKYHYRNVMSIFKTKEHTIAGKLLLIKYGFISNLPTDVINYIILINKKYEDEYNFGLYGACMGHNILLAELMISKGATKYDRGLYGACMGNNILLAELMISKGADEQSLTRWIHIYSYILQGDIEF